MNRIEIKLKEINPSLHGSFKLTIAEVELLLSKYSENFPTYTDHSLNHTYNVFKIASELLTIEEINNLNGEELYILCMSCILHDVGMCLPEDVLLEDFERYEDHSKVNAMYSKEKRIRDIHHELSYDFILSEWELLKIPNEKFAMAIARVSMGHRVVQLDDPKKYPTKYFVKDGRDFVCLPYLACVLRLADELDITNLRTPELLTKYYMPNNEVSVREWKKHISTTQINYTEDKVLFEVKCSDQNNLAALENQFEKIQEVSNYCQKIVRNISNIEERNFTLKANRIEPNYNYINFDPKGIQFSFNVQNVVNTFIGKDLYKNELTALREVIQNSIDSCRYKLSLGYKDYVPEIIIDLQNEVILVSDNGLGMDEFTVEFFFGRLGSSFYSGSEVKEKYDAIGQFGVGVFSYFLLSDFIDIETKTEKNHTLKFRIDKDPKNYFHFFENPNRTSSGTTISLPLKTKIQEKFSYNDYVEYVRHTFNHVDVSIVIKGGVNKIEIGKEPFNSPGRKFVKNIAKYQYQNEVNKLECTNVIIDDEFVTGEISLITNKIEDELTLKSIDHYFDHDSFEPTVTYNGKSSIGLYQKGVFVNYYTGDLLQYTIGNVNVNKSLPINISRHEFKDEQDVEVLINEFEIQLIEKLFERLNSSKDKIKAANNTYIFLIDYLQYFTERSFAPEDKEAFLNVIMKYFYFKIYAEDKFQYLRLNEFHSLNQSFCIVPESEDFKNIYEDLKVNLIIIPDKKDDIIPYFYKIESIFSSLLKLKKTMKSRMDEWYLVYHPEIVNPGKEQVIEELREFSKYSFSSLIDFDKEALAASQFINSTNYPQETYRHNEAELNLNHPYIKYLIDNYRTWIKDNEKSKIVKASIDIVNEIVFKKIDQDVGINSLNELVNDLDSCKVRFAKRDFENE